MGRFRSEKKAPPLHTLERVLLILVGSYLCFLPWAFASVHEWSQWTGFGMACAGFLCALLPRNYTAEHTGGSSFRMYPVSKLIRFPIFWIGLGLLVYITIQGFNPSLNWESDGKMWWLRKVKHIEWLPTSINAPFERYNAWRQLMIYSSAFLLICTLWIGFTRRRSLEILLGILAVNALLIVAMGFGIRMWRPDPGYFWIYEHWWWRGASSFSSFIYRNNAAAYLGLMAGPILGLAAYFYQRDVRRMARSTSAALIAFAIIPLLIAVVLTYSRGGTLLLAGYLVLAAFVFGIFRLLSKEKSSTPWTVKIICIALILAVSGYGVRQVDFSQAENRLTALLKHTGQDEGFSTRLMAHRAAATMLKDHWAKGVGAGGFRHLFPKYIKAYPKAYNGGKSFWAQAHNDWLQIPIELGLAGSSFMLLGAGWSLWRFWRDRLWRNIPILLLVLALGQTLMHAWFDFPFQTPSIMVAWFAVLFIALRWLELERPVEEAKRQG